MNKLREFREEQGLSQAAFGASVGVKKATISRIENRRRAPSLRLVAKMIEASGGKLSANDFMPTSDHAEAS